jgi:hypothetical protein
MRGKVILAYQMEFGERFTNGGILMPDDNMEIAGIRPRWSRVLAVGPEVTDIRPGQYILTEHSRWTRGFSLKMGDENIIARMIENKSILLVADKPTKEFLQAKKL